MIINPYVYRFFGSYHGLRKTLRIVLPEQAMEENLATAGVITITPLALVPSMRPMVPYAIMMIVLDAINGLNDV
jgi:hypothetical protein